MRLLLVVAISGRLGAASIEDTAAEPPFTIGPLELLVSGTYSFPSMDPDGLVLFVEEMSGNVHVAERATLTDAFPTPRYDATRGAIRPRPILVPSTREVFMRGDCGDGTRATWSGERRRDERALPVVI